MTLRDLDDVLGEGTLDLPIGGKVYRVRDPDAETGILCARLMLDTVRAVDADDPDALPDDLANTDEPSFYRRVLGPVYEDMLADGVPYSRLKLAVQTAVLWIAHGRDAAETYWERGGSAGEAPAPNRKSRRASGGTGQSTRKRGSTGGTTSPTGTGAGTARVGVTSSGTGT